MTFGQLKQFTFHIYWIPNKKSLEIRYSGDLRPPNEIIKNAVKIVIQYHNIDNFNPKYPIYMGEVKTGFIYKPKSSEQNRIEEATEQYKRRMKKVRSKIDFIGDKVGDGFELKSNGDNIGKFKTCHNKGWLKLSGSYYDTNDSKPKGWISSEIKIS